MINLVLIARYAEMCGYSEKAIRRKIERSQRDTYWKPALRKLGVRQRRAYATRHTFATVALMGGVRPAYVAEQMGHTSTRMFFEVYARWINGADKGLQRSLMVEAFSATSPPRKAGESIM